MILPEFALNFPASQSTQLLASTAGWYAPAGQLKQTTANAGAYFPAAQATQLDDGLSKYRPSKQLEHAFAPGGEFKPAEHILHVELSVTPVKMYKNKRTRYGFYLLCISSMITQLPVSEEYFPCSHNTQIAEPDAP